MHAMKSGIVTAAIGPRALTWLESPVGPLVAAASDMGLCLLEFTQQSDLDSRLQSLQARYTQSQRSDDHPVLGRLRDQLRAYFARELQQFDLPLHYAGTPFQERVWSALLEIPYGHTWPYRDLAVRLGDVLATRAVGTANGMNPIAIVVPCHRVINANGNLGGYGGGLWRKRILLDLEQGQAPLLTAPYIGRFAYRRMNNG